ncbi:hypothetical protein FRC01_005479 [Tulasnella sp. 417]|nr:hypothetical protein FRC01_005479 [Tulasnella sp. 417]
MAYTGHWMVAVAGTLILCMAIVNVVQRRPRNRFAWGYSVNRSIIGVALIIVGGVTSTWIDRENWMIWVLPTVGIGYGLAVVVDWFILFFSVRSIRYMESLANLNPPYSSVEKGDYIASPGVNPNQPEYSPYPHSQLHRVETAPAGMYAQGAATSTASLYAPGRETDRLHQGSQYNLSYVR